MPDRKHKLLLALYAALLHLYPANFRRQFGQEMLAAFADTRDERGLVAALSLLIGDLLPTLLREHLEDSSSLVFIIRALLCALPPLILYTVAVAHVQNIDEFALLTFWLICIFAAYWQTGCRGRACLLRTMIASVGGMLFPLWLISFYQPMFPGFISLAAPLGVLAMTVGLILAALARLAMEGLSFRSTQMVVS